MPCFDRVVTSCPGLRSLDLDCIGRVSHTDISQGLVRLTEGCPGLCELKVIRCLLRNDLANQAMLRGLKNLCVLEVLRAKMLLSDDLLLTLAECRSYSPFLTELEINWSVQRTETVAQASAVLAHLRRLVLRSVAPPPIDALVAGLALLSQVEDLTFCVQELPISKLLTAVAEGSPNLRSLSAGGCGVGRSAAKALIEVARHCPLLEVCILTGCQLVTNGAVEALVVAHGARLRELHFGGCRQFGDAVIFATACSALSAAAQSVAPTGRD
jgi:hypothetical protein